MVYQLAPPLSYSFRPSPYPFLNHLLLLAGMTLTLVGLIIFVCGFFGSIQLYFRRFKSGMWKRKLEAVNFLWKRKHFDERGWKRKRKCWKGTRNNFFKIRRFRIFNLATTVGVNCYNIESTTRAWYGMEWNGNFGMEYGRCLNGMEDFKNETENNLPYFHTNFILDFVHCIYRKIHTDVGWW